MSNTELTSRPVTVQLPLSDWLIFIGWCGAHLTDSTPAMVANSLSVIHGQVNA